MNSAQEIYYRLGVKDSAAAIAELRKFGKAGQGALRGISTATAKPNKALLTLDRSSNKLQGSLRQMAQVTAVMHGPLGGIASRFSGIASLAGTAGLAVGGFVLAAGSGVFAMGKAITRASEYERAMFKIEQVNKTTGYTSGQTAQEIDALSISIGKGTLASVGGARNAAAQLLTFRSISGDAFKRTLTAAQDLAALGFGTIESATVQLAKAMEDPVRGLSNLRRVGVSFTASQEQMIRKLHESGDAAAAQNLILQALEKQVGGAGTAEAGGLAGAYDTLAENVGLFLENIGNHGPVDAATVLMANFGRGVDRINAAMFPSEQSQFAVLTAEAKELGAELDEIYSKQALAISPLDGKQPDQVQLNQLKMSRELKEQELAKTHAKLGEINARLEAEEALKRQARQAAADAKYQTAVEADHTKALAAEAKFVKGLVRESKQEATSRVAAKKAALKELTTLEDRAAKAQLHPLKLLARERVKNEQKFFALKRKGLITEKQFQAALLTIDKEYAAKRSTTQEKVARDFERQQEKMFGRSASAVTQDYFDGMAKYGENAGRFLVGAFGGIEDALTKFFSGAKVSTADFLNSMKVGLARLAAQDLIGAVGGVLGLGSGSSGAGSVIGDVVSGAASFVKGLFFADGGKVRGPGTGTSDSIPAFVSNGEFIINAQQTKKWLPMLHAINDNQVPGFAQGGVVGADGLPRFSLGGSAGDFDSEGPGTGSLGGSAGDFDGWDGGRSSPRGGNDNNEDYDASFQLPDDVLQNVFDEEGNIIDRRGGSFFDKIGSFFGAGTDTGFFGSRAAGALTGILSMFTPSALLAGFAINLGREAVTSGIANNSGPFGTGLAGAVYDVLSGRKTIGAVVDGAFGKLDKGFDKVSSAFGLPGAGGAGTRSAGNDFNFGDNGAFSQNALTTSPRENMQPFQDAAGVRFGSYQSDLEGQYRSVESAGTRVLRGLRKGGRFQAGEEFVVGEERAESIVIDRPGTVNPSEPLNKPDNSEVVEAVTLMTAEIRKLREDVSRSMRQMAGVTNSYATGAAQRRVA